MKIGMKKLAAVLVCAGMLGSSPAMAGGFPVFDGAALGQMIKDGIEKFIHYKKIYDHYNKEYEQWKEQFDSQIRGPLSSVQQIDSIKEMSNEEILQILNKRIQQCNSLVNEKSKNLCITSIQIDNQKIKLYFATEDRISQNMKRLDATLKNYERVSSKNNNGKNSGVLQTIESDIRNQMLNINNIVKINEHQIKLLDTKQEMIQKARTAVTQEQLQGAFSVRGMAAKAAVHAAIVTTLKSQAGDYKTRAEGLRKRSSDSSNKAFYR